MAGFIDRLRGGKPAPMATKRGLFARKRSRFLWLKIALAAIALLTGLYLVTWSYRNLSETRITVEKIEQVGSTDAGKIAAGLAVNGINLEGKSKSDRPFSVSAQRAMEPTVGGDVVELTEPQAEIELSDATWLAVTADRGTYHRSDDRVELAGAVTLYHENGMTFRTESASVDLRSVAAEGAQPISGQDERRQIQAEGFQLIDEGKTLIFTGRSKLTIQPKPKDNGQ